MRAGKRNGLVIMTPEEIKGEVDRLSSSFASERALADTRLTRLSPSAVSGLMEWSSASNSMQGLTNACGGCAAVCLGVGGLIGAAAAFAAVLAKDPSGLPLFIFWVFTLVLAYGVYRLIQSRKSDVEQEVLQRVDDPRVSAPLLEWLFAVEPVVRGHAVNALRRLLPRLKASDAPQFGYEGRKALNILATAPSGLSFDTDFVVMAVEALAQVGDDSSAAALARLLGQRASGDREARIHGAAAVSLEALRSRLHVQRQACTLLRATQADSDRSLLRAAGSARVDSEVLLRMGPANPQGQRDDA